MMLSDIYIICWCGYEDSGVLGAYTSLDAAKAKITTLANKCHDVVMKPNGELFTCYEDGDRQLYYIDRTILHS